MTYPDVSGPMAPGYGESYFALVKERRPLRGLEVGCETGQSAANFLLGAMGATLLSVDIEPCPAAFERLERHGVVNRWSFMQGNAGAVLIGLLEPVYDWVYIDGDHSYEQTIRDIYNGWNLLQTGGTLVIDDYLVCPGVGRAVDEFDASNLRDRNFIPLEGHPYGAVWAEK